jgi:hypothetical protein
MSLAAASVSHKTHRKKRKKKRRKKERKKAGREGQFEMKGYLTHLQVPEYLH